MNVISLKKLRAFWAEHDQAETPLREWFKDVQKASYQNLSELRAAHPRTDFFSERGLEITIFDIGGNKYRVITFVRYSAQSVFIKLVMTHAEYDRWNRQGRPL